VTGIVFTVGNDMRGDDGAGPLLAKLLEADPAPGWIAIDGGAEPENLTYAVRGAAPRRVLVVDAADMGLAPGEIRFIDEARVTRHFLLTTHTLPLTFLIASLRETIPEIVFLGIQPADIRFLAPMTEPVRRAVEDLHRALVAGRVETAYAALGENAGP
jgi:hydrogenase 3 maturation protease